MELKVTHKDLIDAALAEIETHSVEVALSLLEDENTVFVDLRDPRELQREGKIPNAFHAPRGMLEFWVDPDSPYHKRELGEAEALILHCNKGWRSALAAATLQDMGLTAVAHMDGGFERWRDEGFEVAAE